MSWSVKPGAGWPGATCAQAAPEVASHSTNASKHPNRVRCMVQPPLAGLNPTFVGDLRFVVTEQSAAWREMARSFLWRTATLASRDRVKRTRGTTPRWVSGRTGFSRPRGTNRGASRGRVQRVAVATISLATLMSIASAIVRVHGKPVDRTELGTPTRPNVQVCEFHECGCC